MMKTIRLIDTHAHLQSSSFSADRDTVIERAMTAGIAHIVEVGYDLPSSRAAVALAEQYPHFVSAVVGIQPNHAHEAPDHWLDEVRTLAGHPSVVAIGEIGLDYYRNYAPQEVQEHFFRTQLALAGEVRLPVVIHSREAQQDTVRVLQDVANGTVGIMHSFSGNWEHATSCLEVGFWLSFSGPVTFRKAVDLHDVVRRIPIDRILIETDSPYLSPHPFRGTRNEPAYVQYVAERIAALRSMPLEELTEAAWTNAEQVFGTGIAENTRNIQNEL